MNFWINTTIILCMFYYLYKMGNRLYWNQRYFNDKTKLHDIYMAEIDFSDVNQLIKYTEISWTFRDVENRSDYKEWEKERDETLSFLPSIQKKKRNKKIEEILNGNS